MEMGLEFVQSSWVAMAQWRPQPMGLYAMLTVSAVTAGLMLRVVGGIPYVVGTINFAIMFFCAYFANFLGRDIIIHSLDVFQRAIVVSFTGQIIGAILILLLFRVREGYNKRF